MKAKLKVSDFYYGAVLSLLFNHHIKPALVLGDDNRQVYDIDTDNGSFRLFIKYSMDKQDRKTEDYYSWVFTFTNKDIDEILTYIDGNYNLLVAFVCGVAGLAESEIAILSEEEIKELIDMGKTTLIGQ